MSFSFLATNGQSAAVAAQYMLSGQQYQSTSGQHPAGHMVPSHCFLAAIFMSFSFLATNGQSAAVAAQYMLSGQRYQSTSGQHPAGHMVPSHCFLAAIHELFFLGNKWTISSSSSTVHVVRAAVPVNFRATSSWAHGSFTLFLGSHLYQLLPH